MADIPIRPRSACRHGFELRSFPALQRIPDTKPYDPYFQRRKLVL